MFLFSLDPYAYISSIELLQTRVYLIITLLVYEIIWNNNSMNKKEILSIILQKHKSLFN